jgi:hypothetical protein
MKKAFDTVHPDFIRIALQRMGLDDTHTNYYVRLNSAGRIIVRSPYAQHHLAQHGRRLLNHIDDTNRSGLTYFTAGRGIGQGDVTSAIIWLLVFDVLLTALDMGSTHPSHPTRHRITTCSSSGLLQTNNETCFSDDLTSISPSFLIRQRKADIVSAFAIMFKLTIAQDKLRSLVQEWGHEPLGPFFFAKDETISYNKMQQVTHIDNKVERLQVIQARAGSWAPRRGSVIHYRNNTTGLWNNL